jgi:hypothetical protein
MKNNPLFFSLALLFSCSVALAQDYTFKVLVSKGKNEIKKEGNWQAVKVGTSLNSIDELKVSENAYIGLVHISGKPLEVKDPGKYKVMDLSAKMSGGPSVLNKYTDFILSSNDRSKNNLTATGAVHRGGNGIHLFLPAPDKAYMLNDSVSFQWSDNTSRAPYTIVISNLWGDELAKLKSNTNTVDVNFAEKIFAKESEFRIEVASADNKTSDAYTVRKLTPAEKNKLQPVVKEMKGETAQQSGLYKMMEAGFYEQNKLLVDAVTSFLKAVKLEPALKDDYEYFLLRNALKDPEEKKDK